MSSSKIAFIINKMLKINKENMTIHKSTVCRILNKELGRPRKVKRVFFLTDDQKRQRIEFCEKMLKKGIKGGNIFFSDETKIDMGSYFNDSIRLTKENKEKLKKGSQEVYNLINRPQRKFEPSIMVAGGVCSSGLSNLIFLNGAENEFSYAQILFYFKVDIERLKSGNNKIYFEQDGATPHTTESNINLIKRLFGEDPLIQNPPNSPDLAYPIESLWGYIKPRIKKRNPKTLDELKKFTLEEWNNIPKKIIEKTGVNYERRLKKVIEIKGERLEDFHLREIKKEAKADGEILEDEKALWEEINEDEKLVMKVAYNDKRLNILRNKHIAQLKKNIEKIKRNTRENIHKINQKGSIKIPGIVKVRKNKKIKAKEEKNKRIEEINKKIKEIEEMDLIQYLKFTKAKKNKKDLKNCGEENENDDESTIEEAIDKIFKIKEIYEDDSNNIKYELEF